MYNLLSLYHKIFFVFLSFVKKIYTDVIRTYYGRIKKFVRSYYERMENAEKIIEFAPIICVILMFVWQNNVFVRPEQLEKKHREIIKEVENEIKDKYVELNAYKEFQNHIYSELSIRVFLSCPCIYRGIFL